MSRVDEIIGLQLPEGMINSIGIESAYCSCLLPNEACDLLLRAIAERHEYRDAAVRRVCLDIENDFLGCHESLVEELIAPNESISVG